MLLSRVPRAASSKLWPSLVRIIQLCTTVCKKTKAVSGSFEPLASFPLQSPLPFGEILSTSLIPKHDTVVLLFLSMEERIAIACFNWNTGQTGYGVTLCHAVSLDCSAFQSTAADQAATGHDQARAMFNIQYLPRHLDTISSTQYFRVYLGFFPSLYIQ